MSSPLSASVGSRRVALRSGWAKLALAVLAPALFLGVLEIGLRLGGYGHSTAFFIREPGSETYRTNPRFTETYFPASFGLKPLNFRLTKEKPAGVARVFVLGESAAMGVPEPGFGLAPHLRAQLQARYPGRAVEVFNLGVTAINSHVIRAIAAETLAFSPDLLVIYAGNNEVVGPYGPGSTLTDAVPPRALIRASLLARRSRLGQLVLAAVGRLGGRADYQEWRGMETFGEKQVSADDPRLAAVYSHFRDNLADLLELATAKDVPVVLSTVAVNLTHCAPFSSLPFPTAADAGHVAFERGIAAEEREDLPAARAAFAQALAQHPRHAETHSRLARVLERQGEPEAARLADAAALEWDTLRFRADARINAIIREEAATRKENVRLVDAAEAFAAADAPSADTLFFEHVHLTFEGNHLLAQLLAGPAGEELFGASGDEPLSRGRAAAALGYTAAARLLMLLAMDELINRPPFTRQYTFAADRTRLKAEIAALKTALAEPGALAAARDQVQAARTVDPENPFLTAHLTGIETQRGELAAALALVDELERVEPPSPESAVRRGYLLQRLGRTAEAEALYLQTIETSPYYFQTYGLLGSLWAQAGEVTRGRDYFAKRVRQLPNSIGPRHMLANFLMAAGETSAAEEQWRFILTLQPDDEAALDGIVRRLFSRARHEEAIALLQAAHAYNPRNYSVNARLLQYFQTRNDAEGQIHHLRALAESGPVPASAHLERAALLLRLGRQDETVQELYRARRKADEQNDRETLAIAEERLQQLSRPAGRRE